VQHILHCQQQEGKHAQVLACKAWCLSPHLRGHGGVAVQCMALSCAQTVWASQGGTCNAACIWGVNENARLRWTAWASALRRLAQSRPGTALYHPCLASQLLQEDALGWQLGVSLPSQFELQAALGALIIGKAGARVQMTDVDAVWNCGSPLFASSRLLPRPGMNIWLQMTCADQANSSGCNTPAYSCMFP